MTNIFTPEAPGALDTSAGTYTQQAPSLTLAPVSWNGTTSSMSVNIYSPEEELTEEEQMELLDTFITYQQHGAAAFTPHEEFMKELFPDD